MVLEANISDTSGFYTSFVYATSYSNKVDVIVLICFRKIAKNYAFSNLAIISLLYNGEKLLVMQQVCYITTSVEQYFLIAWM